MSEYGRAGTKAARLRQAVHELLLAHEGAGELPTSNRFLFYELVGRGELDKSKTRRQGRGADQDLADASKWLRDQGLVPWSWIVDERRSLFEWRFADTVADYASESVPRARINCWGAADPPLIICESATFGGVLKRGIAADYLCPVTATSGQVGGFLHTNVAPVLQRNERQVLYVGDLDDQGEDIEANTRRVLVHATGRQIEWHRLALTADQANEYGLSAKVKVDRRFSPPRVSGAIEVEEAGQGRVMTLVRGALDALVPEPLDRVQEREQDQRREIAAVLARLNGKTA